MRIVGAQEESLQRHRISTRPSFSPGSPLMSRHRTCWTDGVVWDAQHNGRSCINRIDIPYRVYCGGHIVPHSLLGIPHHRRLRTRRPGPGPGNQVVPRWPEPGEDPAAA